MHQISIQICLIKNLFNLLGQLKVNLDSLIQIINKIIVQTRAQAILNLRSSAALTITSTVDNGRGLGDSS